MLLKTFISLLFCHFRKVQWFLLKPISVSLCCCLTRTQREILWSTSVPRKQVSSLVSASDPHHSRGTKSRQHVLYSLSLRSPQFLLPAVAGLLYSLLYLHPASVPGFEERRPHAHSPQSPDHSAGVAGLLSSVQLHPLIQVGFRGAGPSPCVGGWIDNMHNIMSPHSLLLYFLDILEMVLVFLWWAAWQSVCYLLLCIIHLCIQHLHLCPL